MHNYYLSEGFVSGPTPLTAPIGINNVILAAIGDVKLDHDNSLATGEGSPALSTENSLDISSTFLNDLLIYSQNGSVTLGQDFGISADGQNVSIATAGTNSDITIAGFIDIYGGSLLLSAGRDVYINGDRVGADVISIRAGRDVTVDGAVPYSEGYGTVQANTGNLTISAKRHIHITNSAQLFALSQLPSDALLRLESSGGDITVDNRSRIEGTNVEIEAFAGNISILDSTITATHALKARTLLPNGTLLISNSTLTAGQTSNIGDLIRLYADGSNGKVLFQGNVTLNSDEVQIAGKTVQVDPGGTVTVSKNNAHIFADQHNYNVGPGYGVIVSGSLSAYGFSDSRKPDFKTGGKLGRAGP